MRRILSFLLIPILFFVSACTAPEKEEGLPVVVVSIPPQQYFVDYLAQGLCQVHIMIPPGSSHESYEPKPSDIQRVEHAIAYFRIGAIGFEQAWIGRLQSLFPDMMMYDLSEGIETDAHDHTHSHDHGHGSHICNDPHYWMSARASLVMAENIRNALMELFPTHADSIATRFELLAAEIQELDDTLTQMLLPIENKAFAIFHPVLGYFAEDYGLIQLAMEEDGKEPTPARLKEITQEMQTKQVSIIFIQKEFNTEHAQLLAQETGARIVVIDPMSIDWKEGLIFIASTLTE